MKPLSFQPNDEEAEFIYEHISSWSKWCHKNLKKNMSNNRFNILNRVAVNLLITSIGLIISFLGLIVRSSQGIIAAMFILGGILVIYGVFSIIGVVRYG